MLEDDYLDWEKTFHNAVRDWIVTFLLSLFLLIASYVVLNHYKVVSSKEIAAGDNEDLKAYYLSFFLCIFTLSVSMTCLCLLPLSILSNEIVAIFPTSAYFEWVNGALLYSEFIHMTIKIQLFNAHFSFTDFWYYSCIISQLSTFILMPFAYLFMEATGFSASRKGVMSRVSETVLVLCLVAIVIFGCVWIGASFWGVEFNFWGSWHFYFTFLYGLVSQAGLLLLLLSVPAGFTKLLVVCSNLIRQGSLSAEPSADSTSTNEEIQKLCFERDSIRFKISSVQSSLKNQQWPRTNGNTNGTNVLRKRVTSMDKLTEIAQLSEELSEIETKIDYAETHQGVKWFLRRNLAHPLTMLLILFAIIVTGMMVALNFLQILLVNKTFVSYRNEIKIGVASLSVLGIAGSSVNIAVIIFCSVAALLGLYRLPIINRIAPSPRATHLSDLILNCFLLNIMCPAFPIFACGIGLTNFELLSGFGQADWLSSSFLLKIIFNGAFLVLSALSISHYCTSALWQEISHRLNQVFALVRKPSMSRETASALKLRTTSNASNSNGTLPPVENLKGESLHEDATSTSLHQKTVEILPTATVPADHRH